MRMQVKKELGLERPVYIGHSWGAWLGLLYAAVFPDQVWLQSTCFLTGLFYFIEMKEDDASILEYFDIETNRISLDLSRDRSKTNRISSKSLQERS
jgi:pimeloyl-ACP methyl ester carboxylesterase